MIAYSDIAEIPRGRYGALLVDPPWHFRARTALGFKYSAVAFTWVKLKRSYQANQLRCLPTAEMDLHVGLGLTTRKNAEFVLLGRRGNAKRLAKNVREIIMSPVREHSRKPDEVYARIERYCAGPYLDVFSRQERPKWDSFGNEARKFNPPQNADSPRAGAPPIEQTAGGAP